MRPLTKIQKHARGKPCYLRVPGICREAPEHEHVVLCHAPYPGKFGVRDCDWWAAPGCFWCHNWVDDRSPAKVGASKSEIWGPAIKEWQDTLLEDGFLILVD